MKTAGTQRTRSNNSRARREEVRQQFESMPLIGQILTWSAGSSSHKYTDIVKALKDEDLSSSVARELLPRFAFARACSRLKEEKVIDYVKEDSSIITFQFTKKHLSDGRWKFGNEVFLKVDKVTGKISCDNSTLEEHAQAEINRCMEMRTSNDITKIVQRLFELEAQGSPLLFPIRDQGGAYFVFQQHAAFINKIHSFLNRLGGKLDSWPIADATKFGGKNQTVTTTVANALQSVIDEHKEAVAKFGLDTRAATLEATADEIKATRVRVEAFAEHLGDLKEQLLKSIDDANGKLRDRIEQLSQTRSTMPQTQDSGTRTLIFGHSVTAVIRWMGHEGWDFRKTRKCLDKMGMAVIADATIRAQIQAGRNGERGPPAPITEEQANQLEDAIVEKKEDNDD